MNRSCRALASTLVLLAVGGATAHAQTGYPDRPVKIIVPIGQQLVAAAFMKAAGVKFLEVPYKGSPPAFTDLLPGRIDLFFDSMDAGLP